MRVIQNLIQNGIDAGKFRPTTIRIRISADRATSSIEISDDGVGMTPDALKRIATNATVASTKGSGRGIGLKLVSHILEMHHGTITAKAAPNTGTTIRVSLPRLGAQ
jgi:signal transduction histidine kinase